MASSCNNLCSVICASKLEHLNDQALTEFCWPRWISVVYLGKTLYLVTAIVTATDFSAVINKVLVDDISTIGCRHDIDKPLDVSTRKNTEV